MGQVRHVGRRVWAPGLRAEFVCLIVCGSPLPIANNALRRLVVAVGLDRRVWIAALRDPANDVLTNSAGGLLRPRKVVLVWPCWQVSRAVGNVNNNEPSLIEPASGRIDVK